MNSPTQKPKTAPGSEPTMQPDRRDDERREVGVRPEELDLRDRGDLEDHHGHAERDEAGDELRA